MSGFVSVPMKEELREQLRAALAKLAAGTVRAHSAAVWERLAAVEKFQVAKCIGAYVSVGSEIETHGLIRQLLAIGRRVCVPAFAGEYVPAEIADFDADLVTGKFGILEPRTVQIAQPDVWLVPGLGFDKAGNRLGRGKAYYDALLAKARGVKIALAHDFQMQPHIPTTPRDVRMDWIVTEKHCYETALHR